jgi:hypothetical protein
MASIISIIVSLRIGKRFIPQVPFVVLVVLVILTVAIIIIYRQAKSLKVMNSDLEDFAFWQAVLRYFLSMDMIMFALQKIFHMQFVIPLGVLDNPFSSLSGEELMWAFFGKYYAFTVIIALSQISGAVLLLFRRTWLCGVIILLPVLINILLLDWFYNLGVVVNSYITLITLSAVYLLLSEFKRLKEFFFIAKSSLPQTGFKHKNIVRLSAIFVPVLFMAFYSLPESHAEILGKYKVKSFAVNGKQQDTSCHDNALTKVFIDNSDFVMEYGNYQKRWIGDYSYNKQNKQIRVIWRYPAKLHDTLTATILSGKEIESKVITGLIKHQKLQIEMEKVTN